MATILTVDVGTSAVKAALYNLEGQVLATSSQGYGYRADAPGRAEGDPEAWWSATCQVLADLREAGGSPREVEAVAFTGQMHTVVALDHQGRVIPPTILWLDRRADRETEELVAALRLPPHQLNSTYSLPKLLWLRRHRPDALDSAEKILWPKDYLRYRLTGVACTDLTEAGGASLLDWERRDWALDRLAMVGLSPDVLPEIRPAEADGGPIRADVAQHLELNPEAKVVVGMGDVAALYGGAPRQDGRVVCSLGSSSMVFAPLPPGMENVDDPQGRIYVYPFGPYPMLGGVSSTTGAALTWLYEQVRPGFVAGSPLDRSVEAALQVEPGCDGLCFLPYLAGERSPYWSDDIRGGFYGLRLTHDGRHLMRAVLEGVAFSLRHLLDIYGEIGVPITEIALAAGGTQAPGWAQIMADVCGRDVHVYAGRETVTRVLFALCMAHLRRADFDGSLHRTFGQPLEYRPRRDLASIYDAMYSSYRAFSDFAARDAGHRARDS